MIDGIILSSRSGKKSEFADETARYGFHKPSFIVYLVVTESVFDLLPFRFGAFY